MNSSQIKVVWRHAVIRPTTKSKTQGEHTQGSSHMGLFFLFCSILLGYMQSFLEVSNSAKSTVSFYWDSKKLICSRDIFKSCSWIESEAKDHLILLTYNFFIIFCTNMPFYSIVLCRVIDCFCWQTVRFRERWPPPQRFLKTTQESEIGEKKCRKL